MVKTTGRLLKQTTYGFRLEVINAKYYIRSQLNEWRLYTFLSSDGSGVDGSYETARFNEKVNIGTDTSFGLYQKAMPQGALGVSIADLRPSMGTVPPTEIPFLPIIVQLPMQKAVRILAPSGYIWDFLQTEFRYKAPGRGVPTNQAVRKQLMDANRIGSINWIGGRDARVGLGMAWGGMDSFNWRLKIAFNCLSSFNWIIIQFHDFNVMFFWKIVISYAGFSRIYWTDPKDFRHTYFPKFSIVEILRFPKMICFSNDLRFLLVFLK